MTDPEQTLRDSLPPQALARLQSLRLSDAGVAIAVLDVSGFDAVERERLEQAVKAALTGQPGVAEVRVALTADKVRRRIVAVGSGKGGVGKSTVSANLAVALARMGRKVGLVDADIYGPSQPRLLGNEGARPEAQGDKLIPVPSKWGVPVLSMGHLIAPDKAIAWRGPMASNALGQLIDADWGAAEVLIVDLPPGTGDVQLTMLQRYKPAGAVIVSTPQDLALIDARRAIQLFEVGEVPVIGLVENMAGYACPHCGEVSDPFGQGGAEAAAADLGQAFLGRIPLDLEIRKASDAGTPPAAGEGPQSEAFAAIARRIATWLDNA
ncbi:MAG: Mrp/NBP35 family ATP-binding protein [Novosphingobium sp.]|uniref:Mrp/NBP35 family ATP-binding protein n=1 Tax=Novosphingobium sp. TaxID=1874826 RepID=UPI001D7154B2|nr:Mrp/NBP35 family ATP-binding protein [Novosphingobium sp.]MCB2058828.1 Mrp/NBP35 family ATP-binding protein [Novosphingobium sp.]MCP5387536.1 Mrp/NBP35 family ATP-binding protein [Novosphingobium sp.]